MNSKEWITFSHKEWSIDCPTIVLKQDFSRSPTTYRGPGSISQNTEGQLIVKLYCPDIIPPFTAMTLHGGKPGKIVPKTVYFSLNATDLRGKLWTATNILPRITSSFGNTGIAVTANIRELCQSGKLPRTFKNKSAEMVLRFAGNMEFEFPCNAKTESRISIGNTIISEGSSINVAKFKASNCEFIFYNDDDWFTVQVFCNKKQFLPFLDLRISEALQFIFARSFEWSILEVLEGNKYRTHLRPLPDEESNLRIRPPLISNFPDDFRDFWKLFEMYLGHIVKYDKKDPHSLSGHINDVIKASSGSPEAEVLAIAISIEGILRTEFTNINITTKGLTDQINTAKTLIKDSALDEGFKRRIYGSLGAMLKPRAIDWLNFFLKRSFIKKEFVDAWKTIRHSSAHAEIRGSVTIRKLLRLRDLVMVLLYRLIFLRIGYTGKYSDYRTYGWPRRMFTKSFVQSKNIVSLNQGDIDGNKENNCA